MRRKARKSVAVRHALLWLCASLSACGRFGFEERDSSLHTGGAHPAESMDAGAADMEPDAGPPGLYVFDAGERDAGMALDAGSDGATPDASLDAAPGPALDGGASDAGTPPPPPPVVDPGCSDSFPTRLWPVASDVQSCTSSLNVSYPSTGPGSAEYTIFNGCSTWLEFQTTPNTSIQVRTYGDGCTCTDCTLWHIHYLLEEDFGSGLVSELEVQAPDTEQCPASGEVSDLHDFVPSTTRVRLQTLSTANGSGFYFAVCGAP